MLVRRLLAAIIHDQRRRTLTTPTATVFVPTTSNSIRKTPHTPHLLTQLKKILLKPFEIVSEHNKNVMLATSSIDRALRYSGFSMSTERRKQGTEDDRSEEQVQQNASSPSKENTSTSIESIGEPDSLDELRESYMRARKESSNVWLDFSNKSCYIYLYRGGGQPSESIAAFDLDGTIIKPKDNKKFCTSAIVGYPSLSDSDINFASKLGLPFLAPEEFLQGVKPKLLPTSSGKTE